MWLVVVVPAPGMGNIRFESTEAPLRDTGGILGFHMAVAKSGILTTKVKRSARERVLGHSRPSKSHSCSVGSATETGGYEMGEGDHVGGPAHG